MNVSTRAGICVALALGAIVGASRGASAIALQKLTSEPTVTTFAGSGRPGIADGPAAQAEFMGPEGIAYDKYGDLYVADTPAQRIRMVDPHGNVTTVAGSGAVTLFGAGVGGGYRNGSALQAQFNAPTGVAVGPKGTIYVADLRNRCIREIRNGVVSTLAGDPSKDGDVDGPIAVATFSSPRGVAVDAQGRVWVADGAGGVREIARGRVSTLALSATAGARNVSVQITPTTETLFVTTPHAVVPVDLKTLRQLDLFATGSLPAYESPSHELAREGAEFVGPASAAAGLGLHSLVYTDDLFSSVHLAIGSYTRILGRQPLLRAGAVGGGFADGSIARAEFKQPMGIAVAPDGAIAVADTGNRRIRLISPFDRTIAANDPLVIPDVPYKGVYRVAIVGDSYVWDDVSRARSIGQIVWNGLCAARRARHHHCTIEVYPVRIDGTTFDALASYIRTFLTGGLVNDVYFMIPTYGHMGDAADARAALAPAYSAKMTPVLRGLQARMRASHTQLTALLVPGAWDMPDEATYRKLFTGFRNPGKTRRAYLQTLVAVRASGVRALNLWPAFFGNDAHDPHRNLFGAWDHHYTIFGNAVVAHAILHDVLRAHSNFVP